MATATDYVEGVLEKVSPAKAPEPPSDVEAKIKRGRERLKELVAPRRECIEFANNNHYAYLSGDGMTLKQQATVTEANGTGKPSHRVRLSRDLIGPVVKGKISATTQRVPGYESVATSNDAEDYSAANLARKVAIGGYDLWRLKRNNKKLVWNALVTEEGFIRAYWDTSVGPFVDVSQGFEGPDGEMVPGEPEHVGMGEAAVQVYSGLEVMWEPGVDFEESRWWAIEHARPVEDVESEDGFIGEKLKADADASDIIGKKRKGSNLVMVTEFLERPCPKYPNGRRLMLANGRVVFAPEDYPLQDKDGAVVDEPCIHRLSYDIDASSDRDKGLVRSLIESMREIDHAGNKILEWMQLMLNPQWTAPAGSLLSPNTDEPGAVKEISVLPGMEVPKPVPVPPIPPEFFTIQERGQELLKGIAHETEVPTGLESAKGIQAIANQDALAWQDFIEDYADVQARVMRDLLTLVQIHYSEDRLVKFRGRTGWEAIADFKGADIRGQTDIHVSPSSLEPRTRASTEQRIQNIAQMFPGYFPPEVLISALEGGSAEKLIEGYEDDVARANRIVSMIRSGEFFSMPERPVFPGEEGIDPETEQMLVTLPGWMPRPFDNISVHKSILELWMKQDDWQNLEEAGQLASMQYYNALLALEAKQAQRKAELQSAMAEQQGEANAAKPQGGKPMPSLPAAE